MDTLTGLFSGPAVEPQAAYEEMTAAYEMLGEKLKAYKSAVEAAAKKVEATTPRPGDEMVGGRRRRKTHKKRRSSRK